LSPGGHIGVGVITTLVLTSGREDDALAEEIMDVEANPARARARTEVRIAKFFMGISPWQGLSSL
jgi:hypothetical protein